MNILIQVFFAVGLLFEAMHDKAVIELQYYQHHRYKELSRDWHRYNVIQYVITCAIITWPANWIPLFFCLLLLRSSVFPLFLNIIRGVGPFYLGNEGFDGTMQKILGRFAGLIMIVGSLIVIVLLNIYL